MATPHRMAISAFLSTDIAAAATCDIGASTTTRVRIIAGTGPITSFGVVTKRQKKIRFATSVQINHNATSLILPGGVNISAVTGDTAEAFSDISGNWIIWNYTRASGKPIVPSAFSEISAKPTTLAGYGITDGATDAEVAAAVAALVASSPATLDTLNELAAALGNDANFAATMTTALAGKISNSLLTTRGDIITRDATVPQRLALGTSGYALKSNGTDVAYSPSRELLIAARTYYVRTDGSDSNNGLANTSGGAFLTLQKAVDFIAKAIDLGGQTVTIQVGDGTYTAGISITGPWCGPGLVIMQGNSGTPANVLVSTAGSCVTLTALARIRLKDMKLTASAGNLITLAGQCYFEFGNIDFGTASARHMTVESGSLAIATSNYAISGGAINHIFAQKGAYVETRNRTVTITGTPAFTAYIFLAGATGCAADSMVFSGSATGVRYDVRSNSWVETNVGGANYFPGNAAGSTASGGQYA